VGRDRASYCTSCYTGQYLVEFPRDADQYLQLTLKLQTDGGAAGTPVADREHTEPAISG
jgi:hypothetical protein